MARGNDERHNPNRRPMRIGMPTNVLRVGAFNPKTAPFAKPSGEAITDPVERVIAANEEFKREKRIPGKKKHFGWMGSEGFSETEYEGSRPIMRSIDRVGMQYAPTVYDITNDMAHELQTGYWTKRGAKKVSKEMLARDVEFYSDKED